MEADNAYCFGDAGDAVAGERLYLRGDRGGAALLRLGEPVEDVGVRSGLGDPDPVAEEVGGDWRSENGWIRGIFNV